MRSYNKVFLLKKKQPSEDASALESPKILLNYYPAGCHAVKTRHKDNVLYGATETQLTQNKVSGLFLVPQLGNIDI